MKKLLTLLFVIAASISTANAHWSDSYNGDHTEGPGIVGTIIGFIVLIVLAGISENDK